MIQVKIENLFRLLPLLVLAAILYSCATESTPLGGPEDKAPPELKEATPANKSIRFTEKKIELTFNEFIQGNGSFNQTIISPSLSEKLDVRANGKTVTVKLKGELHPNTTYTLNFGDDIKDINQGNILSNFTYVFSTGSYIDSQTVSGKITLAENGNAADGFIVSLYPEDSIDGILSSKPLYFAKTNSSGLYKIENIKAGRYRVFTLKDQNFNYLFDQPNEEVGFSSSILDLTDSLPKLLDLVAFKEKRKSIKFLSVKSIEPGKALIAYSAPLTSIKLGGGLAKDDYKLFEYSTKDTLILWFSNYYTENVDLFLVANDTLLDTVRLECKFVSKDSALLGKIKPLSIENQLFDGKKVVESVSLSNMQALYGSLKIKLSRPVAEINQSKALQILDSATMKTIYPRFSLEVKNDQELTLSFDRTEKTTYFLIIPDSTFKDVYGFWNKELRWKFKTNAKEDYGNIRLKLGAEDVSKTYFVQLINASNEVIKSVVLHNTISLGENLTNLAAGIYHITVLEDTNKNSEWDTGNIKLKLQPEKYLPIKDNYTLKGGWDLDVEVKF